MMGGRLLLDSEPDRGSRFHFTTTVAIPAGSPAGAAEPHGGERPEYSERPLRVLLDELNQVRCSSSPSCFRRAAGTRLPDASYDPFPNLVGDRWQRQSRLSAMR
jgi:hypothetical protein